MATNKEELGGRQAAVLHAVIEEFIRTGEPVGSETVAERYELNVSPATIRSEMAALEELGYLSHPHTSAGRIPTHLGYRQLVDSLPQRRCLHRRPRTASSGPSWSRSGRPSSCWWWGTTDGCTRPP